MKAFTDDATKIGIPTVASGALFQQTVEDMNVFCTDKSLNSGTSITTGSIEFWPNNYGPANKADVPNASGSLFDFGDEPAPPVDGYGSMQVHNFGQRQTVFAVNHWSSGGGADIGIGNSPGAQLDWTFTGNANSYTSKRLRVFVRTN